MKRGIDCSRHQGLIAWPLVAPHVDEVLIRASMGATGRDDAYSRNWQATAAAGITQRGFYHLATSETPWRGQRDNIARVTGGDFGTIAAVLDCERTARDRERMAAGWRFPKVQYTDDVLELAFWLQGEAAGGVRIYSNASEIQAMTTQTAALLRYGFHGAGYPFVTPQTFESMEKMLGVYKLRVPAPWLTWEAWQAASTGRLPGIAGNVDLNFIKPDSAPLPAPDTAAAAIAGLAAEIAALVN